MAANLLPFYVSNLGVGISNNVAGPLQVFGQGSASGTTGLIVASNAFVGVGKSNPAFALDVTGDLNFTGTFRSNGVPYIGSQWTTTGISNLYYSNASGPGFVGIGKTNPGFALDVLGDLNFTGTFRSNGVPYVGSQFATNAVSNITLGTGSNLGIGLSNPTGPLMVMGQGASSAAVGLFVGSNALVGVGKSNPGFALDVLGDLNFTGTFRSNGVPYIGSQWTTVGVSNLYYSNVNGGGFVGIGKSNPAYALDVIGDLNFTGALRSNGMNLNIGPMSSIPLALTYVELLNNNNTLAMTSTNHTYTTTSFMSPSVPSSAIVAYSGSGWVTGAGLFVVTVTLNGTSRSVEVFNPGTTHMPTPNCHFVVQLAAATSYTITLTFSNNALTDANDYHNLNVTMFPNSAQGSLNLTSCYALWYSTSNVPAGNYVGTTAYGGTTAQNAAGNGAAPFSTSTGLFTCQYTGVYQCNFTTNTYLPQDTVQIWRNGALIAPGYQAYGNLNNSISVSASVFCNSGDTLGFYVSSGTIQGTAYGTQGCSIALVGSAGNITTPFTTSSLSNISLPAGSNLGIGKVPAYALDVAGDLNFTGTFRSNGIPYIGSQWTTLNTSNLYYSNVGGGLVGIGKSNPAYALDILGDINFTGIFRSNGVPYVGSQWTTAGTNIWLPTGSNVGIGTSTPSTALQVAGTVTATSFAGPLTGNVTGNVTGTAGGLSGMPNITVGTIATTGNVGIGKTSSAYTLDVAGSLNFSGTLNQNGAPYVGSQWTTATSNVYLLNSNVAIGKSNPSYALDVVGDINVTGAFRVGGSNLGNLVGNVRQTAISRIKGGYAHTIALSSTGQVYAWGYNDYGQLGNNSITQSQVPVAISITGTPTITAIAGGYIHTIALSSTGQVYAWGNNIYGQLGNNSTTQSQVPVAISITGSPTITAIACGNNHTIALSSTSQVYAWGRNDYGQLGNNSTTQSQVPVAISITGSPTITAIACGYYHTLALSSTGQVYAWGYNGYGQLGNNSTTQSQVPVAITYGALATSTLTPLFTNFTGQHRCFLSDIAESSQQNYQGLIACATNNKYSDIQIAPISNNTYAISSVTSGIKAITINESLPVVSLCTKANDKSCFGVISMSKDNASTEDQLAIANLRNSQGDSRVEINAVGEGAIWVSDANGALESGDYITTSSVTGYGQRQNSEFLCNYTVAKITMDCDFNPAQIQDMQVKRDATGAIVTDASGAMIWEPAKIDPSQEAFREAMDAWHSQPDQMDPSTMPEYVPSPPEQWVQVMEPAYKMRYLAADGSQISKDAYDAAKAADSNATVYRAAFVGCTYHCG